MSGQITLKMENIREDIEKQFSNLYCKKDFTYQLKIAKSAPSDAKPRAIRKLVEMFRDVGIECERGKPVSYYERLIPSLTVADTVEEVNGRLVKMLFELSSKYPKPEDYMERIVNRLEPETALSASLELRILRRFLKTVNVRENKRYYSKSLKKRVEKEGADSIGEEIFDVLKDKPEGKCDYLPIVQACSNLAHGVFISPTSTKELLFIFAFAYGMKYYLSKDEPDYEEARDVEKNLFIDYYSDNLTRFLVTEEASFDTAAHKGNDYTSGSSDNEPAGIVINSKSFVDAVFVYYLNREDMTASERTVAFFSSVDDIKSRWKERRACDPDSKNTYEQIPTRIYKGWLNRAFFEMSDEQMCEHVLDNYYCDVRYLYLNKKTGEMAEGSKGVFELTFSTNTAYAQYQDILSLIKEGLSISESADFSEMFDRLDYRAMLNDHDAEKREDFATDATVKYQIELKQWYERGAVEAMSALSLFDNTAALGEEEFFAPIDGRRDIEKQNFITVIKNVKDRLNPENALCISDASKMTRTKIIAAYYHYFCLDSANNAFQFGTWKSFKDVFEEMGGYLGDYLEDAGYQRISSKNLFDMFVIFLAYCKINDFLS